MSDSTHIAAPLTIQTENGRPVFPSVPPQPISALTASAFSSFVTPQITVPFPSGYGQSQIPFSVGVPGWVDPVSNPVTEIGGSRPIATTWSSGGGQGGAGGSGSGGGHGGGGTPFPTWAIAVTAGGGAFFLALCVAGCWYRFATRNNRRRHRRIYASAAGPRDGFLSANPALLGRTPSSRPYSKERPIWSGQDEKNFAKATEAARRRSHQGNKLQSAKSQRRKSTKTRSPVRSGYASPERPESGYDSPPNGHAVAAAAAIAPALHTRQHTDSQTSSNTASYKKGAGPTNLHSGVGRYDHTALRQVGGNGRRASSQPAARRSHSNPLSLDQATAATERRALHRRHSSDDLSAAADSPRRELPWEEASSSSDDAGGEEGRQSSDSPVFSTADEAAQPSRPPGAAPDPPRSPRSARHSRPLSVVSSEGGEQRRRASRPPPRDPGGYIHFGES